MCSSRDARRDVTAAPPLPEALPRAPRLRRDIGGAAAAGTRRPGGPPHAARSNSETGPSSTYIPRHLEPLALAGYHPGEAAGAAHREPPAAAPSASGLPLALAPHPAARHAGTRSSRPGKCLPPRRARGMLGDVVRRRGRA